MVATDTLSFDFGRDKPYYVYLYRDPRRGKRGEPIYVGKGSQASDRADAHWKHAARNPFFKNVLKKLRMASLKPSIEILAWFDEEKDAFALEKALIARIGRRDLGKGPLLNLTDGGEGTAGRIAPDGERLQRSLSMVGLWQDEIYRSKTLPALRATAEQNWNNPEWVIKRFLSSEAARAKRTPEQRASDRAAISKGKKAKAKEIGAQTLKYYATAEPEKLVVHRLRIKAARMADADATGIRTKKMWAEPGRREKQGKAISVGQTSSWADPEKREARIAKVAATRARNRAEKEAEKLALEQTPMKSAA